MPSFRIHETRGRGPVKIGEYFQEQSLLCQKLAEHRGGGIGDIFVLPWITPVLGSGSLSTAGSRRIDENSLVGQLAARLATLEEPPAGSDGDRPGGAQPRVFKKLSKKPLGKPR